MRATLIAGVMKRTVVLSLCVGLAAVAGTIVLVSANGEPHGVHRGPHPMRSGPIVVVKIEPYPEGPPAPPFLLDAGPNQLPVRKILRFIPRPLPEPLDQGLDCEFGGNLTIKFEGGAQVAYGPCHRPASINRLWADGVRNQRRAVRSRLWSREAIATRQASLLEGSVTQPRRSAHLPVVRGGRSVRPDR